MAVSIYKPGQGRTRDWILEYEPAAPRQIDPLMGWTSSTDTRQQVTLAFESKEEAIQYATRNGLAYTVIEPTPRKPLRKAYADNFKFGRPDNWTH